ncbi:MAG: NAD(P)-dependent oxidoreductase [Bacteroidota bacterium]
MKRLLITGASGFLGYHLLRLASVNWEVYGITYSKNFYCENTTAINCDIRNYIELGNFIDDIEPDAVIHTAAISDANFCEQNKELSYEVNVEATRNLAGICCDYNIPFSFTSTDLVFDGKKGKYQEEDEKNPLSTYGEHKSIAEDEVLRICPRTTVMRLPLMFGYPEASTSNYLNKFLFQIRSRESVKLFHDEYRSVCGAKSIAEGILKLFENNSGIIHLAGKEKLSRYDFGMMAAKAFELDTSHIQSCSQKDFRMNAQRPADVSLDIAKAVSLGFNPLLAEDELKLIAINKYFD